MEASFNIYTNILENISNLTNLKDIKNIFWKANVNCRPKKNTRLNILLLNSPCNGFGDVIFCNKILNYLQDWYNCKVTIATTDIQNFKNLGLTKNIISIRSTIKETQCRRFKKLKFETNIPKQDLIFIAPMQADYEPNLNDVKPLIPYANKFNTFFFSEYNPEFKNFDFPTGVGKNSFGLLFTDIPSYSKKKIQIENPYVVTYIAESIDDSYNCFCSFIEMVCVKYHNKYKSLDIIIPSSIEYFFTDNISGIIKNISKYYPNIRYIGKSDSFTIQKKKENKHWLTFRADILPLPYDEMLGLIKYSIKEILLTGDQSITDALSCCPEKNIFYQIAGWKENFAEQIGRELPNKYILNIKTSCGSIKAIKYKSNYSDFIKNWDFRKLAKPKLDAIISSAIFKKENSEIINDLENIIMKSKSINAIKNKIGIYLLPFIN
jgi:hypothetical protein